MATLEEIRTICVQFHHGSRGRRKTNITSNSQASAVHPTIPLHSDAVYLEITSAPTVYSSQAYKPALHSTHTYRLMMLFVLLTNQLQIRVQQSSSWVGYIAQWHTAHTDLLDTLFTGKGYSSGTALWEGKVFWVWHSLHKSPPVYSSGSSPNFILLGPYKDILRLA